jgi:hypothetical protein
MKHPYIGILAFILALLGNLHAEPPTEIMNIVKNPPTLKHGLRGVHFPEKNGLLIQSPEFISHITIIKQESVAERRYTFRTYSNKFRKEIVGEGRVFEHYYRISDPHSNKDSTTVIDKDSILLIDAGLFKAEWSLGDYIYLPDAMTVKEAPLSDYTGFPPIKRTRVERELWLVS